MASLTGLARAGEHGGGVASHSRVPGTRERRVAVAACECVLIHLEQRDQVGCPDVAARRQLRVARAASETHIPRTDVLAHVAPEYPIPYVLALLVVERSAMLDREIRNAAIGV